MSADLEATAADMSSCASCGKAALDDVKLKKCACELVKYCSVGCQKNHRPQHKKACKKKMAELRDDKLFVQPDGIHFGECPICCLPLPLHDGKSTLATCCGKLICKGCNYANQKREAEQGLEQRCPFCREPPSKSKAEHYEKAMKRAKANDPVAMNELGKYYYGEGNFDVAFQYFTKAAALGYMSAHYYLSLLYGKGGGVERDEKKKLYHLEEAAIGGHPYARFNLGCIEGNSRRFDRAMKHFIIAANLGLDEALDKLKQGFVAGLVSKEDYAAALRGHQAAVDATKSQQREEAYVFFDNCSEIPDK